MEKVVKFLEVREFHEKKHENFGSHVFRLLPAACINGYQFCELSYSFDWDFTVPHAAIEEVLANVSFTYMVIQFDDLFLDEAQKKASQSGGFLISS